MKIDDWEGSRSGRSARREPRTGGRWGTRPAAWSRRCRRRCARTPAARTPAVQPCRSCSTLRWAGCRPLQRYTNAYFSWQAETPLRALKTALTFLVLGVVAPEPRGALEQLGALEAAAVLHAVARQQLLQLLHVQKLQLRGALEALQVHLLRCLWNHITANDTHKSIFSSTSVGFRGSGPLISRV